MTTCVALADVVADHAANPTIRAVTVAEMRIPKKGRFMFCSFGPAIEFAPFYTSTL